MTPTASIAIDLGSENGRVIVGALAHQPASRLALHEVHRFNHQPLLSADGMHWDIDRIWMEIRHGLAAAASWSRSTGVPLASVGVDTWGVDFVLLDDAGRALGPPRCYRDARHASGMALLRGRIGLDRLYEISGIQEASFNTLTQLAGAVQAHDPALTRAARLLLLPDYFHHLLAGGRGGGSASGAKTARTESCIASTTQMLDARAPAPGVWSHEIISALGLNPQLFGDPVAPGSLIGPICSAVAEQAGLPPGLQVIAPAAHDTACAVAAVPAHDPGRPWAYLSSGSWSLMGAELPAPILTPQARAAGFTNERGFGNTIRFHKNLVGLWLVQELKRDLERAGTTLDYAALTHQAESAEPFRTRIDASHPPLAAPGDMIAKLRALARAAGDSEPDTPGRLVRCCLESLAMAYRRCLEQLETITARRFETIHIVGGGCKNALLCQLTADATGRRVLAGPVEATAAGNVLVQATSRAEAPGGLSAIRAISAQSFDVLEYTPRDAQRWDAEYRRHAALWMNSR